MKSFVEHRIRPQHLARRALVYIRQSSPGQVRANVESTRVQLGLRDKAIALGWNNPLIVDHDLGISAAGFADRPGFQNMLAQVSLRQVGIILCLDASRLSRNSKDWANLFELCGYFDTLIADLDQVYDLAHPNDRLVLGIKGTVSELELSVLRTRLKAGAEAKAARGELKFILPPGYVHDHAGRIVQDPDLRVRQAITLMFDQFDHSTSLRQLVLFYRDTHTLFPVRKLTKARALAWQIPTSNTLYKLLIHPIYAGAYVYGRRTERVEFVAGRLVKRSGSYLDPERCRVCIRDHHQAYIDWERFLANRAKLAESRPRWSMNANRGAIRSGEALLAGLLRCGHCGSMIGVSYKKEHFALYRCDKGQRVKVQRCGLAFGSKLIDLRVGQELCRALSPLAIDGAKLALARRREEQDQATRAARLHLQAAQYEVDRAFEQFDLVDPKNRLVADSLEERLNQRLAELREAQEALTQIIADTPALTPEQRRRLDELARDFPALWNHPQADIMLKKQLLRAAVHEIVVTHQPDRQRLEVVIHWQGGVHTHLHVEKRATPQGCRADPGLIETVRALASLADAEIARILNMKQITTPRSLPWTKDRVCAFRGQHHIRRQPEQQDGDHLTGQQAAERLGISRHGLQTLFRIGVLHNLQTIDFAPWRIPRAEVESDRVRHVVKVMKANRVLPRNFTPGGCPSNQPELFPVISRAPE
ncbi:MAG: recombinase family protein [Pseudomonadota bacterium]